MRIGYVFFLYSVHLLVVARSCMDVIRSEHSQPQGRPSASHQLIYCCLIWQIVLSMVLSSDLCIRLVCEHRIAGLAENCINHA